MAHEMTIEMGNINPPPNFAVDWRAAAQEYLEMEALRVLEMEAELRSCEVAARGEGNGRPRVRMGGGTTNNRFMICLKDQGEGARSERWRVWKLYLETNPKGSSFWPAAVDWRAPKIRDPKFWRSCRPIPRPNSSLDQFWEESGARQSVSNWAERQVRGVGPEQDWYLERCGEFLDPGLGTRPRREPEPWVSYFELVDQEVRTDRARNQRYHFVRFRGYGVFNFICYDCGAQVRMEAKRIRNDAGVFVTKFRCCSCGCELRFEQLPERPQAR